MSEPTLPKPLQTRSQHLLHRERSRLLIVDVQEKLLPGIAGNEFVSQRCGMLATAAELFGVPIRVTEQYPKGLGKTVVSLRGYDPEPAEKLAFSAADACGYGACDADESRDQVVICGIESHICVLQTALDLASRLWRVIVVTDAIGARSQGDHERALQRLNSLGVDLATTEMVLFEWAERAGSDQFKAVSKLVRALTPISANG